MTKLILHILLSILLTGTSCLAADVLIIADTQYKPVKEVSQGIRRTLNDSIWVYSLDEVNDSLAAVVKHENARVIIALGYDALAEALKLSASIPIIYSIVAPMPTISRTNTSGFYMTTPAKEYTELLHRYLPSLNRTAVAASRDFLRLLANDTRSRLITLPVRNSFEFIDALKKQNSINAILLLPDNDIITSTALDEVFLLSFRRRIPILGVSEKNVSEGALLALVADMTNVGKVMGEYASRALKNGTVARQIQPPRKFDLYLNLDTARRMRIRISDELMNSARKVYQ